MIINKKTMAEEAYRFLETLFSLEEVQQVAIKDVMIQSLNDVENINRGLERCYHDSLSDVDINVWLKLHPIDFEKATPIYKLYFSRLRLENIFGITFVERTVVEEGNKEGFRICLNTGYRMDFTCFVVCDTAAKPLEQIGIAADEIATQSKDTEHIVTVEASNRFWFIAIQALAKLLRQDYLIADHLSYMMLMDGLVVQMVERDAIYHTNFHRYGYGEALAYQEVSIEEYQSFFETKDQTYNHIAENLCRAVLSYDALALKFNTAYESHIRTFFEIWQCYLLNLGSLK